MEHNKEEKGLCMGKHSPYTSVEDERKKIKELGGRLSDEAVSITTDKDIGCKAR